MTPLRMPPLNALRAFEVAGRTLNFSKAASELHVTPAAISHQIKSLEEALGVKLFHRLNRSLQLTEAGQALLPGIRRGFANLSAAVDRVQSQSDWESLTISAPPAFGAKWLIPRIVDFRNDHPGIQVRIDPSLEAVDPAREAVEVAIRFGQGNYPGLQVDHLLAQQVIPVCSPALLQSDPPLKSTGQLIRHTLIHFDSPSEDPDWPTWKEWLLTNGITQINPHRGPHFTSPNFTMQAVLAGQGVALMPTLVVEDELADGRLVQPFSQPYPGQFGYYALTRRDRLEEPPVAAFRRWLIAEASKA